MSWWAAAFQALGSAISSRSSKKEKGKDAEALRRMQEMEMAQQRNLAMWQRGNELEDRRYRQESFGNYAQFNKTPGLMSPELSSTTPTPIQIPQGVDPNDRPEDHNQGLMYFKRGGV